MHAPMNRIDTPPARFVNVVFRFTGRVANAPGHVCECILGLKRGAYKKALPARSCRKCSIVKCALFGENFFAPQGMFSKPLDSG